MLTQKRLRQTIKRQRTQTKLGHEDKQKDREEKQKDRGKQTKEQRLNLSAECLERALETSCGLFLYQPLKKKDTAHRYLHPVTAYKAQTLQRHGTCKQHKTMSQPTMTMRNILHLPQPKLMYGKLRFHSKRGGMLELTQEKEQRYACQRRA